MLSNDLEYCTGCLVTIAILHSNASYALVHVRATLQASGKTVTTRWHDMAALCGRVAACNLLFEQQTASAAALTYV
jgi:hypothetical protein